MILHLIAASALTAAVQSTPCEGAGVSQADMIEAGQTYIESRMDRDIRVADIAADGRVVCATARVNGFDWTGWAVTFDTKVLQRSHVYRAKHTVLMTDGAPVALRGDARRFRALGR
ncbi:MAG: hypothetical protein AAGL49_08305 [Pseudomonadota bacterium]